MQASAIDIIGYRWVVRRLVARGGMCRVYESVQTITGRTAALKIIDDELLDVAEVRERLLFEARVLASLDHPRVVALVDAGIDGHFGPFLATEMLGGRTLEGMIAARGTLPVELSLRIACQLAEALDHVHRRGFLHRDVKPANVIVTEREPGRAEAKLIDFGIATAVPISPEASGERLTLDGELVGTPEYMAPERLLLRPDAGPSAEVYALGALLYECLTGRVPFPGTYAEVLRDATTRPVPPLLDARPDAGAGVAAAIHRALAREPADRFPSVDAFRSALLSAALGTDAPPPSAAAPASPAEAEPQRRRFPRAPYVTPVRVLLGSARFVEGRSEDISEGGMMLVLPPIEDRHPEVKVQFAPPGSGRPVTVRATARWSSDGAGRSAVGLEFRDAPPQGLREIRGYVRAVSEPVH
jgi:serine/threonine-protein kinase